MNTRSLVLASAFALSICGLGVTSQPALAQQEALNIAVVDMDMVISQSAAGKALAEKLNAFQEEARGQIETHQERIRDMRQKITDAVNAGEDQALLINMQKQFEEANVQLRRFTDDKQREAQRLQSEGMKGIQQQFEPVFKEIQDEFDYDLILNKKFDIVLMVGDRINITQMVIDKLQ